MRVKYFAETDTAILEFSTNSPVETQELNENIYVDLDGRDAIRQAGERGIRICMAMKDMGISKRSRPRNL